MKAMVLCAGYGSRLGKFTQDVPKPMLRAHSRPLLEYIIQNLARHGFDEIVVNLWFLPKAIPSYFGDGSGWGVRITYIEEAELLGTAGSVRQAARCLQSEEPFLVHYGDVLTNQDYTNMLEFHRNRQAAATILVHERPGSNSVVDLSANGQVLRFLERPSAEERSASESAWAFSGVAIFESSVIATIPSAVPCDFPRDVFPTLSRSGKLYGFPLTGGRCAVDSPERLQIAQDLAADFLQQWH